MIDKLEKYAKDPSAVAAIALAAVWIKIVQNKKEGNTIVIEKVDDFVGYVGGLEALSAFANAELKDGILHLQIIDEDLYEIFGINPKLRAEFVYTFAEILAEEVQNKIGISVDILKLYENIEEILKSSKNTYDACWNTVSIVAEMIGMENGYAKQVGYVLRGFLFVYRKKTDNFKKPWQNRVAAKIAAELIDIATRSEDNDVITNWKLDRAHELRERIEKNGVKIL